MSASSPAAAGSSPIFIVGNRRSGTTLLRLMFASHPDIGVPPEGGFLVLLGWVYGRADFSQQAVRQRFIADLVATDNAADWRFNAAELTRRLNARDPRTFADAADEVYRGYLGAVFPGKRRWGDKTTWYLDYLPQIMDYFPAARIVHLIRDGRDVLSSYRRVDQLTNDPHAVALEWTNNITTIRKFARRLPAGHYVELRYEALVARPETELRRACEAIGERYAPEMLDFWRQNVTRELEPQRHMRWKQRTTTPASADSVGRFRDQLTAGEIRVFEAVAGDLLRELGYLPAARLSPASHLAGRLRLWLFSVYWSIRRRLRPLKAQISARAGTR